MRSRSHGEQPRDRFSDERRTPKVWRTRGVDDTDPAERQAERNAQRRTHNPELEALREKARAEISAATERLRALPPPGALHLDRWEDLDDIPRGDRLVRTDRREPQPFGGVRGELERVGESPMSAAQRPKIVPRPVVPLDEASRSLVPPARIDERDERTAQREREEEIPSTEPDGNAQLARARDAALADVRAAEEPSADWRRDGSDPVVVRLDNQDQPSPSPVRDGPAPVEHLPLRLDDRAVLLDPEGPTPHERPIHNRPTELDDLRAAPTVTNQIARALPLQEPEPMERSEPRREVESKRERELVKSMYDSERAFVVIKAQEPNRAAHIESIQRHLAASGRLDDRELVLMQHAREKTALQRLPPDGRQIGVDRVLALALHARQLDDRWVSQMHAQRDQLVNEIGALPKEKRDAVFADFESFGERDGANDSLFCRREMESALKREPELHKAYVYALALDKQRARAVAEPHAPTKIVDESSADRNR